MKRKILVTAAALGLLLAASAPVVAQSQADSFVAPTEKILVSEAKYGGTPEYLEAFQMADNVTCYTFSQSSGGAISCVQKSP
jgi:hypothetical protein